MSSADKDDLLKRLFDIAIDASDTCGIHAPLRKHGYIPSNCGEPTAVIPNLSTRNVYRGMSIYINEDPTKNCCTIDDGDVLKLYKATELPVKLTKADRTTTFFCSEELDLEDE